MINSMHKTIITIIKTTFLYISPGILWLVASNFLSPFITSYLGNKTYFHFFVDSIFITITTVTIFIYTFKNQRKLNTSSILLEDENLILSFLLENLKGIDVFIFDENMTILTVKGNELLKHLPHTPHIDLTINNLISNNALKSTIIDAIYAISKDSFEDQELLLGIEWYEIKGRKVKLNTQQNTFVFALLIKNITNIKDAIELQTTEGQKHLDLAEEYRLINDELKTNREKYTSIFEHLPEAIMIQNVTPDGHPASIAECNPKGIQLLSISPEHLASIHLNDILTANESEQTSNYFQYNFIENKSGRFNMQLKLHNGRTSTIELNSQYLKFGNSFQLVTLIKDITSEIRIKKDQAKATSTVQNITEYINSNIIISDADNQCEFWSHPLETLTGNSSESMQGKPLNILFTEITGFDPSPHIIKAWNGQANYSSDFQSEKLQKRWFRALFAPFYEAQLITGIITIITDVTEQKKKEMELINQKIISEEMTEVKKNILSNISHEIRTPLNNINGFLNIFSLENLSSKQKKYLNLIKKSSDQLLETVTNIVNISLLESNQLKFNFSWFRLSDLLLDIEVWLENVHYNHDRVQVNIHGVELSHNTTKILCERERIKQLLEIFTKNAIKFTPKGTIDITGIIIPDQNLKITIRDTGIGMERTYSNLIFQPFLSAHSGSAKIYNGIGLGLSIAKKIIDKLKGTINVESEVGHGTTFTILIPVTRQHDQQSEVITLEKELAVNYKNALLIEDSYESSELLKAVFSEHDIDVTVAATGTSAIEAFYEKHNFDIVFCDIRLPDIDGFEVLKALRRMNPQIPVIAQTAYVMRDSQKKCREAGFNDFLGKPLDLMKVTKVLTKTYSSLG